MGVWTTGPRSRAAARRNKGLLSECRAILPGGTAKDVEASPYSIAAYDVHPSFGGNDGLSRFRDRLHANGLRLLLDFVPNHIGLDHRWLTACPDYLVHSLQRKPGTFLRRRPGESRWFAHGKDPYFAPWTDTVQVDFRKSAARKAVLGELHTVAQLCDGVRCDMSMLVLNEIFQRTWGPQFEDSYETQAREEFWDCAIASVKTRRPEFIFLAEVYWGLEERLLSLGFDFAYEKVFYDRAISGEWQALCAHVYEQSERLLHGGARFLENHDEQRVASRLGHSDHSKALLFLMSLPGLRLIHQGQLTGARLKVPVQLARFAEELQDPEIASVYAQTLGAFRSNVPGHWLPELLPCHRLDGERPAAFACCWTDQQKTILALINFEATPVEVNTDSMNLVNVRLSPVYEPQPGTCPCISEKGVILLLGGCAGLFRVTREE